MLTPPLHIVKDVKRVQLWFTSRKGRLPETEAKRVRVPVTPEEGQVRGTYGQARVVRQKPLESLKCGMTKPNLAESNCEPGA